MQPKILILGTGGTIAGMAADTQKPGVYQAAQLTVQSLLDAIPGLENAGGRALGAMQIAQIDSKDMEDSVWLALLQACDKAMRDDAVAAVVITHGTDTLEETAWFLHQCLGRLPKPVVLTCAMRPANALMPDGPQNLLDAVTAAGARDAQGQPLLRQVVAATGGGELHRARWVQKVHPHRLLAFSSGEQGLLGWAGPDGVRLRDGVALDAADVAEGSYRGSASVAALEARATAGTAWPWVEIITSHAGARAELVDALLAQGVRGLVVASTGNGTVHQALEAALARAVAQGVPVWRATRCADGCIDGAQWPVADAVGAAAQPTGQNAMPAMPAIALSPVKARISLQLALMGV